MSIVEFDTDDPDLVQAYNVAAHDEASNRYKPTSLKDSLSEVDWGLFGLFLQAWRGNAYFTELAERVAERVERCNYEDFVDVARRYRARTPGGEWLKVQTELVALYGQSKRTGCSRARAWCACGAHAARARTGTAGGPCAARALRAGDPGDPRTFVYRMVVAAATLPDDILALLEQLQIPNTYIHENPYFVGQGPTTSPGPQLPRGGCSR